MICQDLLFVVPVLNQYRMLFKLLDSVEQGTVLPAKYLVVDNGRRFDALASGWVKDSSRVQVHRPEKNLGVPRSFNLGLAEQYPYTLISNDDVVLGKRTVEQALERAEQSSALLFYVGGVGFSCVLVKRSLVHEEVGYIDEGFFPAYCGDSDFLQRMSLRGFSPETVKDSSVKHFGNASRDLADYETRAWLHASVQPSIDYFTSKWGVDPWHVEAARTYPASLDAEFERIKNENWVRLCDLARQVDHAVEVGGPGPSTVALLRAQPKTVRSYVHAIDEEAKKFLSLCGKTDIKFLPLSAGIEKAELVCVVDCEDPQKYFDAATRLVCVVNDGGMEVIER